MLEEVPRAVLKEDAEVEHVVGALTATVTALVETVAAILLMIADHIVTLAVVITAEAEATVVAVLGHQMTIGIIVLQGEEAVGTTIAETIAGKTDIAAVEMDADEALRRETGEANQRHPNQLKTREIDALYLYSNWLRALGRKILSVFSKRLVQSRRRRL